MNPSFVCLTGCQCAIRAVRPSPLSDPKPIFDCAMEMEETIRKQAAEIRQLEIEHKICNGSCDIVLARRQVGPDGIVPGNARECAELWECEASRQAAKVERLKDEATQLREAHDYDIAELSRLREVVGNVENLLVSCCPVCDDNGYILNNATAMDPWGFRVSRPEQEPCEYCGRFLMSWRQMREAAQPAAQKGEGDG